MNQEQRNRLEMWIVLVLSAAFSIFAVLIIVGLVKSLTR